MSRRLSSAKRTTSNLTVRWSCRVDPAGRTHLALPPRLWQFDPSGRSYATLPTTNRRWR